MRFISLRKLLQNQAIPRCLVEDALLNFSCHRDVDIENSAKTRAILFEEKAKSRTYLFFDRACLSSGKIEIIAFFSVGLQVLELADELSNRERMALDGFSGKIHGEKISKLPVILLGQLAKNDKYKNQIDGNEILQYVFSVIKSAHGIIGGRLILIDIKTNATGLIEFYKKNGFELIYNNDKTGFSQMIYKLCE